MKYLFWLLLSSCLMQPAFAQSKDQKLDEQSIVRDSSGSVYPYAVWKALYNKGTYGIWNQAKAGERPDYVLGRLSEKQITERMEKYPKPAESKFFKTGKAFPQFKGYTLDEKAVSIKSEQGKILVINFWFINCPPCQQEIPQLNELVASFKTNENVRFLAVALDSKYDLRSFLHEVPFTYDVIYNGRFLTDRLGISSYPTHVILDGEGKIFFHTTGLGGNTVYWLKRTINELLATKGVAMRENLEGLR